MPDVEVRGRRRGLVERVRAVVAAAVALVLHEDATEPLAGVALPEAGECSSSSAPRAASARASSRRLVDVGARAVRLGPHVLRTSTAGPVALAMLAERLGRWA